MHQEQIQKKNNPDKHLCLHCGLELTEDRSQDFCCSGCKLVYQLIQQSGLEKYYQLKDKRTRPLFDYLLQRKNYDWIENLPGSSEGKVSLQVEGLQCAACVWLIQNLAKNHGPNQIQIDVNLGKIDLEFNPNEFDLKAFVQSCEKFSYRCAAPHEKQSEDFTHLRFRLAICTAVAMNSMFLSISIYLGLNQDNPNLFNFFLKSNFFLSCISVLVGGSYFFKRSYFSLKAGIFHFDLPISLGILGAFLGSSFAFFRHDESNTYFDSLNIFITLMLFGRYLQEKLLISNRNRLLEQIPLSDHEVKVLNQDQISKRSFASLEKGETLLIPQGGIIPVKSKILAPENVECSLAWINGESTARLFTLGSSVPSGALNLDKSSLRVETLEAFSGSQLEKIAQKPPVKNQNLDHPLWLLFSRYYVFSVLTLAALAFALHSYFSHWTLGLSIMTSILVITCPCSIGIAIPLARYLTIRNALLSGIYIRDFKAIERLNQVDHIVFDKTGTLSFKIQELSNPEELKRLSAEEKRLLFSAVAQSQHPLSISIYEALLKENIPPLELLVHEKSGQGLFFEYNNSQYFLGRSPEQGSEKSQVIFLKDGTELNHVHFKEKLVDCAQSMVEEFGSQGKVVHLLSGDYEKKVLETGRSLNIEQERIHFEMSPQDKEAYLAALSSEHKVFMVGDGINDLRALQLAYVSASPLEQNSLVNQNSDLYYIGNRLSSLNYLFALALRYQKTEKRNIVFSIIYNSVALSLCFLGLMSPLLAAILMPLSSLGLITWTSLQIGDTKWT